MKNQTSEKEILINKYDQLIDKIDKEIYKLYGLTSKEIKIVEDSLR